MKGIFFLFVVLLIGCSRPVKDEDVRVQSIRVDRDTLPMNVFYDELDTSAIEFDVTYSNGEVERINLNGLELTEAQKMNLNRPGFHTFNIEYENRMTYFSLELLDPYQVIVEEEITYEARVKSKSSFTFNNESIRQLRLIIEVCEDFVYYKDVAVDDDAYAEYSSGDKYEISIPRERFLRAGSEGVVQEKGTITGYEYVYPDHYYFYVEVRLHGVLYQVKVPVDEETYDAYDSSDRDFEFERNLWK